jgi:hypothetical protein
MKLKRAVVATALFFSLLVFVYALHTTFFRVHVILYAAMADTVISTAFAAVILYRISYFKSLDAFHKAQLVLIWILMGCTISITIPTVIDRSLSLYILEKLQQRGGGIKQIYFEQIFKEEYMKEYRLVDVRLTEQLESGTISIDSGCVKLTNKGQYIASFGQYFRKHWLPKARLLMGQYTDDLTDPFRNSSTNVEYACR